MTNRYVGVVGCTVDHFEDVLKWAQEPGSARDESIASSLALFHDWVKRHDEIRAKNKSSPYPGYQIEKTRAMQGLVPLHTLWSNYSHT